MCGKGSSGGTKTTTQNQTSTTTANPEAMEQYRWLMGQGRNLVEDANWNPATGQQVADFSGDQNQAFQNIRGGIAQPYVNTAAGMTFAGAGPASQGMAQYTNPWTSDVVDATIRDFGVQNDRQMSGVTGNARMAGSLGGDREAVAKALTAEAQSRTQAPILANLRSQGFNTALGAAQSDAARSLQGAGIMGNLGNLAYTDTQALMSAGALQQALEQQRLNAASSNASAESAFPFQSLGWFANLASGLGSQMGSTTHSTGTSTGTTQGPTPNTWSQAIGLGLAALPYLNMGGRVGYAGGGGIGYIPPIQIQRGAGPQPHQMMSMSLGGGGSAPQKGLADHWREITETAKSADQAFKGASKVGEAMRTERAPNGWGTVTTTYADPVQNASYGLSNAWGGIQSALGFAAGGAVDDNDPAGMYDAAPVVSGIVPPPRPMAFPDVSQMPALMQPGTSMGIAGVPPGAEQPIEQKPIVDVAEKAMIPTAGEAYAPPPADMRAGPLNPSGIVAAPASPPPAKSPGFFERAANWVRSPEGEQALTRAGAAMMVASQQGGRGTTGVHLGQGMMAGLDARDSYRKGEREKVLQQAKLDLAERAARIQEEQNSRAAAMHPYDVALKEAQAKSMLAQATQRSDPTQVFGVRARVAESLGIPKESDAYKYYIANGKLPEEKNLTATELKAIDDSVKAVQAEERVIRQLNRALELNKNAASGWGAETEANVWAGLGLAGERSQNTLELSNILSREAILDMSNTLKGASTDREMAEFQRLSGATTKEPAVRQRLIENALREAEMSKRLAEQRAEQIRGRSFFKPGGMTGASPQPARQPPPAAIDHLKKNPHLAGQFDQMYGAGAAARVIGGP